MQIVIDVLKEDRHVGGRDYVARVMNHYEQDEVVIVYGVMKNTGMETLGLVNKDDCLVDYYLASVDTKLNFASFDWAERMLRDGIHTWEPFDREHTLYNLERMRMERKFFWLPVYYTRPINNKLAKHILENVYD